MTDLDKMQFSGAYDEFMTNGRFNAEATTLFLLSRRGDCPASLASSIESRLNDYGFFQSAPTDPIRHEWITLPVTPIHRRWLAETRWPEFVEAAPMEQDDVCSAGTWTANGCE